MRAFQQESKETEDLIYLMDEFRNGAADALTDFVTGAKSAEDAFKDFFDSIADAITRMIAQRWMDQLFGQQGSTGAGTSGGGWLGAIMGAFTGSGSSSQGSFADLFGGAWGFAAGGMMPANSFAQVNERGFEMATVSGKDYMLTGAKPVQITPNHRLGGGPVQLSQQFVVAGRMDSRTADQMARQAATEGRRALTRNGA
jgi:hypothetical protein